MKLKGFIPSILAFGITLGAAGAAQAINLGFALHTSPPGPEFQAVEKFIELVKKRSNGEINVKVYPSAVLGGERDNLEQLTVNQVQMTLFGDTLPSVIAPSSIRGSKPCSSSTRSTASPPTRPRAAEAPSSRPRARARRSSAALGGSPERSASSTASASNSPARS